jgi:hypothetical protein
MNQECHLSGRDIWFTNINRESSSSERKKLWGKGRYKGNQGGRIEGRMNKREGSMKERKVATAISSYKNKQTSKLSGFSSQAKYTNPATAACRRICQLLRIETVA